MWRRPSWTTRMAEVISLSKCRHRLKWSVLASLSKLWSSLCATLKDMLWKTRNPGLDPEKPCPEQGTACSFPHLSQNPGPTGDTEERTYAPLFSVWAVQAEASRADIWLSGCLDIAVGWSLPLYSTQTLWCSEKGQKGVCSVFQIDGKNNRFVK